MPSSVQCLLWGRAAGRCEFAGCNNLLSRSPVTQEELNIAQKAHIYSFAVHGPRGRNGLSGRKLNGLDNLILVCHACHRKVDKEPDGGKYSADLLREMKRDHERRVEIVTAIHPSKASQLLLYGANIGQHSSPLNFDDAVLAMFPMRYPATADAIELGLLNSGSDERDEEFWHREAGNLRRQFERRVRERISDGELRHISVFAIAPQPLLILLGVLLGDIIESDVYQRHREPQSWSWPSEGDSSTFILTPPCGTAGVPALVLSLSATILPQRIHAVLGTDASIWTICVEHPHNDLIKSRKQLSDFRSLLRKTFDLIKAAHGTEQPLHVFPAAPIATCIELGRIRMPKADMAWRIYDQVSALGGFVPALTIQ